MNIVIRCVHIIYFLFFNLPFLVVAGTAISELAVIGAAFFFFCVCFHPETGMRRRKNARYGENSINL